MLRFVSRRVAADSSNEFEQMFDGRFGRSKRSATSYPQMPVGAARVEVYFSPQDGVAKHVLKRIAAAKRSIRFMAFSYTAPEVVDAMIAKARGRNCRRVVETQNATGSHAAYGALRGAGLDVLFDGNCYILHHKVILIDDRIVITGSHNFTSSAERDNDENRVSSTTLSWRQRAGHASSVESRSLQALAAALADGLGTGSVSGDGSSAAAAPPIQSSSVKEWPCRIR
jgi:phosphatidylserine/phosphatidylglycerophosphate/cardiolipin synthase-like enzyme